MFIYSIDDKTLQELPDREEKNERETHEFDNRRLPLQIYNVQTFGFEGAIRGMRNPYESHVKSGTIGCQDCYAWDWISRKCDTDGADCERTGCNIDPVDMSLARKLVAGGSEHRKFLRMIHVQADIKAPRYWWQEFDTYKVGTVANSSSTMHLIAKRELTIDDFTADADSRFDLEHTIIPIINKHIRNYNEGLVDKSIALRSIKQILPESFLQLRTVDFNYETAMTMYYQRKNHRLLEWRQFCDWLERLPYFEELQGLRVARAEEKI